MMASEKANKDGISEFGSVTWSEIRQQPALWLTTLERVAQARSALPSLLPQRTIITGAGTSAYAAAAIAAAGTGIKALPTTDLLSASREDVLRAAPEFEQQGLLLSLARSGNSPESVAVIERIGHLFPSVRHLAITCNPDGLLGQIESVQTLFLDPRTNDRSLVMTSSFSNLVLAGLSILHFNVVSASLSRIADRAARLLPTLLRRAEEIAASYPATRAVILASGSLQPLACEGSLKILEMTAGSVVALPETYLGLRHGPMSFLREDTIVFCIVSSDPLKSRYEADLIEELRTKSLGRVVAIAPEDFAPASVAVHVPALAPELPDYLRTPFEVVFAQILGYHLSLKAGLNPDQPSPDGVITRVVPKFRIHEGHR